MFSYCQPSWLHQSFSPFSSFLGGEGGGGVELLLLFFFFFYIRYLFRGILSFCHDCNLPVDIFQIEVPKIEWNVAIWQAVWGGQIRKGMEEVWMVHGSWFSPLCMLNIFSKKFLEYTFIICSSSNVKGNFHQTLVSLYNLLPEININKMFCTQISRKFNWNQF